MPHCTGRVVLNSPASQDDYWMLVLKGMAEVRASKARWKNLLKDSHGEVYSFGGERLTPEIS